VINGLSVASLASLETSYSLTAAGQHGDKSKAARKKLDIISELKGLATTPPNEAY
jgi:hypothetical protein